MGLLGLNVENAQSVCNICVEIIFTPVTTVGGKRCRCGSRSRSRSRSSGLRTLAAEHFGWYAFALMRSDSFSAASRIKDLPI
jgi:hypothetical protein